MCGKILTIIIIAIAVILAALASSLPPEKIDYVIAVSRFFDIMLPVLAVGALIKYLCCCSSLHKHTHCGQCDTNAPHQH